MYSSIMKQQNIKKCYNLFFDFIKNVVFVFTFSYKIERIIMQLCQF